MIADRRFQQDFMNVNIIETYSADAITLMKSTRTYICEAQEFGRKLCLLTELHRQENEI
jgi:hypothetical protein